MISGILAVVNAVLRVFGILMYVATWGTGWGVTLTAAVTAVCSYYDLPWSLSLAAGKTVGMIVMLILVLLKNEGILD